jgi:hypothetical protein
MTGFDPRTLDDASKTAFKAFTKTLSAEQQEAFSNTLKGVSTSNGGSSSGGGDTTLQDLTNALNANTTQAIIANKQSAERAVKRPTPSVNPDASKGILAIMSASGRPIHESTATRRTAWETRVI